MIRSVGDFLARNLAVSSLEDAEAGQLELDARIEHRRLLIEDMKSCAQSRAALETAVQVLRRQNDSIRNETTNLTLTLIPREKDIISSLLLAKASATSDLERSNLEFKAVEKELSDATSATKLAESSASDIAKQCGEVNKKIISLQSSVTLLRSEQREAQHQVTVLTDELTRLRASLPALNARNDALLVEAEGLRGKRKSIEQSLVVTKQQLFDAKQAESSALLRIERARLQIAQDEEELRLITLSMLTAATTTKELVNRCEEAEEEEMRLSLWKKTITSGAPLSVAAPPSASVATSAQPSLAATTQPPLAAKTQLALGPCPLPLASPPTTEAIHKKRRLTIEKPSTPAGGGGEDSCSRVVSSPDIRGGRKTATLPETSEKSTIMPLSSFVMTTTSLTPPPPPIFSPLQDIDNIFGDGIFN